MDYLEFNEIKKLKRTDLIRAIIRNASNLNKIKLSDFCIDNEKVIYPGIGVYVFLEKDSILYIGKNSSRCFIERIPSHFDLREEGWFNSFIKEYRKKNKKGCNLNDYDFIKNIFDSCSLAFINFQNKNKNVIGILESILRSSYLKPNLNATKTSKWERLYKNKKNIELSIDEIMRKDT